MNGLKNKVFLISVVTFTLVHLILYFLNLNSLVILAVSFFAGLILFSIGFNLVETARQNDPGKPQEVSDQMAEVCKELDSEVKKIQGNKEEMVNQVIDVYKGLDLEIKKIQAHLEDDKRVLTPAAGSMDDLGSFQKQFDHQNENVNQELSEVAKVSEVFKDNLVAVESNTSASYEMLKESQMALENILKILLQKNQSEATLLNEINVDEEDSDGELFSLLETMDFDIKKLSSHSQENATIFEEIVAQVDKIAALSEKNAASTEEISAEIVEFSRVSDDLEKNIIKIEESSGKSIEMLNNNKNTISNISDLLRNLIKGITLASDTNDELGVSSRNISNFVDSINDISRSTNLLALNASIEAARAGTAGKGFSVVADEIKRLSQNTNRFVREIEQIVDQILEGVDKSNTAINQCVTHTDEIEEVASESTQVIVEIQDVLVSLNEAISDIKDISTFQVGASHEIQDAVYQVAQAVEGTNRVTDETTHTIITQKEKNNELLGYCKKLEEMATNVQKLTAKNKKSDEIIFAVNPFTSPDNIKTMYVPILKEVFNKIGYKVRMMIVKDYDALSEGIRDGIIDAAWFSPFAYVNAHKSVSAYPLVSPIVNGKVSYNGFIITKKNSGINNLNDLKNTKFAYVDEASASGYLYARYVLREEGLNPDIMFTQTVFMGSHDAVIKAVLSGEVDAGATYNEAMESAEKEGVDMSVLNVIAKTPDIPKDAIALNPKFSKEFANELQKSFIDYKTPKKMNSPVDGFVFVDDEKYDVIRAVM